MASYQKITPLDTRHILIESNAEVSCQKYRFCKTILLHQTPTLGWQGWYNGSVSPQCWMTSHVNCSNFQLNVYTLFFQTCMKHWGNVIFIKINIYAKTVDLKVVVFSSSQNMATFNFSNSYMCCFQPYAWLECSECQASFAPRYQGHSLSVQCYEFAMSFYPYARIFLYPIHTWPLWKTI